MSHGRRIRDLEDRVDHLEREVHGLIERLDKILDLLT